MIDTIVRAEKVNEELVLPIDDGRFGQAIVIAMKDDAVAFAGRVIEIDAADNEVIPFHDDR